MAALVNETQGTVLVPRARVAKTFFSKLRGRMLTWPPAQDALVFDFGLETRAGAGLHMLLVFYPIGVLFLDARRQVVDKKRLWPFQPLAFPKKPARYAVEVPAGAEEGAKEGEVLSWDRQEP